MKPTTSPGAPDFEQQARRLLARYAEEAPSEASLEARVRAELTTSAPQGHTARRQWLRPATQPRWPGDWARGAVSVSLILVLLAGFLALLHSRVGAPPHVAATHACATVEPNHTIKLCAAEHVQATITLGQAYADATRTEVEAHLSLTGAALMFSDSGAPVQPDSVNAGEVTLQDSQGHVYTSNEFSAGFNYGQERLGGPGSEATPGFFAFDPLPQSMLNAPQTLTLHITGLALFYTGDQWENSLALSDSWTFTFTVTPQPGRSIDFNIAPQTYGGVTVQPIRLDIGADGNDFDYLGSGARLILRVSGLPPTTRRSTVANMSFQFFNGLGAGADGLDSYKLQLNGRLPAAIAGALPNPSLAIDPEIGPSGSIDLEVIFLPAPAMLSKAPTLPLTLNEVAVSMTGSTQNFVKGNWSFQIPVR